MGIGNIPAIENRYSFDSSRIVSEEGKNANVYFINEESDLCVKILKKEKYFRKMSCEDNLRSDKTSFKNIFREYVFMRYVFENQAKVPVPYGVFNLESESGRNFPGFVMEYDGRYKMLRDFGLSCDSPCVEGLISEQVNLIEGIGFEMCDYMHPLNVLWNPGEKDIRIIDAGD